MQGADATRDGQESAGGGVSQDGIPYTFPGLLVIDRTSRFCVFAAEALVMLSAIAKIILIQAGLSHYLVAGEHRRLLSGSVLKHNCALIIIHIKAVLNLIEKVRKRQLRRISGSNIVRSVEL
jgi:hypothetical protein